MTCENCEFDGNTPVMLEMHWGETVQDVWFCSEDCASKYLIRLNKPRFSLRGKVSSWLRFQFFAQSLVLLFYLPYNVVFIGYTPVQLAKWLISAAPYSAVFNTALQLWLSFLRRRGWVR